MSAPSAMTRTFGAIQGYLARKLTEHVAVDRRAIASLRTKGAQGSVVYVVRHRSLLDYLLLNWIFLREGLPLAEFANGVSSGWFGTATEATRRMIQRLRRPSTWFGRSGPTDAETVGRLVEQGQPAVIFLRARSPRLLSGGRSRLAAARPGRALIQEIVSRADRISRPVFLIPVSFARGRTFHRQRSRLATLAYSVHDAPGDLKKIITYRLNPEDLFLNFGRATDLGAFLRTERSSSVARSAGRLTNSIQRELAHQERAVWGPNLLPRHVVAERVFEGKEVEDTVAEIAKERGISDRRAWREARGYFWELAANFNGFAFGIMEMAFHQVWKRAFSGVELRGLDRVVESVKRHPVVLVPCHRSHFDYMVLSYIFRQHFLSPPHIAAGINLAFWPIGSLLRGAGAFFIRRTFDDNKLYKYVFHRYLTTILREGYTLEFFIEGGRSRTGKILTPKLGMLSGVVRAFLSGVRRDLYLVPVSLNYGRVPEEQAYDAELSGAAKEKETFGALFRARSVLTRRHGTVYVSFAEPMSMRELLGDQYDRFTRADEDPVIEEEQRRFVQKLGFRILRDVNRVSVIGATSLTSTVLLSAGESSVPFDVFAAHSRVLAELGRWQGAELSPSLERNLGGANFSEIIRFLTSSKLIDVTTEGGTRRLSVAAQKRKSLDFYKNNSIHFFLLPALIANACLRGVPRADLREDLWWWLDLFRWEFPLPEREELAAETGRILEYFRAHGASLEGGTTNAPLVVALGGILENFRETYWISARSAALLEEPMQEAQLLRRMRKQFDAAMLLGEVMKPEAASDVTFGNAISRLVEMGCLERETRKNRRDRWVRPGPAFEDLDGVAARIGESLLVSSRTRRVDTPYAVN